MLFRAAESARRYSVGIRYSCLDSLAVPSLAVPVLMGSACLRECLPALPERLFQVTALAVDRCLRGAPGGVPGPRRVGRRPGHVPEEAFAVSSVASYGVPSRKVTVAQQGIFFAKASESTAISSVPGCSKTFYKNSFAVFHAHV